MKVFIDKLTSELHGMPLSEAHRRKICIQCRKAVGSFKDDESRMEYELSGLCPECDKGVVRELKKISCKEAKAYCARHFEGKNIEQKLEEVQQNWLDKLEEQILEEQKVSEGGSS